MSTEAQRERQERIDVMRQDADLRRQQQGSTFHTFAQADAAQPRGRFTEVNSTQVVAAQPVPTYPAAATPWQGPDPVGPEPALGFSVDDLEPSTASPPVEGQAGDLPDDPSRPGISPTFERGESSETGDPASNAPLGAPFLGEQRDAGSPTKGER
jgi:hypothetical protein